MHDGKEGDESGNEPAAAEHHCHSDRGHLVSVDQRLAADSVIPGTTHTHRDTLTYCVVYSFSNDKLNINTVIMKNGLKLILQIDPLNGIR